MFPHGCLAPGWLGWLAGWLTAGLACEQVGGRHHRCRLARPAVPSLAIQACARPAGSLMADTMTCGIALIALITLIMLAKGRMRGPAIAAARCVGIAVLGGGRG
jgi:hypothetical protein